MREEHDEIDVEYAARLRHSNTPGETGSAPAWQRRIESLVEASWFGTMVVLVIVFNAILIGLETYPSIERSIGEELRLIDRILLIFFTCEILLRLAATGFHPGRFLRRGWNVFDLLAVGLSWVPGLGANSTALRLIRLLRVARLLSFLPDVRVLLDGIRRAAQPAAGLLVLTVLLLYLYGVVGWSIFGEKDPERWGTVGESMLTLFTLLTLEGWNEIMAEARADSALGVPFILSFVLVGTFVVLNLVIGVVLTSLDEAHKAHRVAKEGGEDVAEAVERLRAALDQLEAKLPDSPPGG
jgi:voltage-gated sodium channel